MEMPEEIWARQSPVHATSVGDWYGWDIRDNSYTRYIRAPEWVRDLVPEKPGLYWCAFEDGWCGATEFAGEGFVSDGVIAWWSMPLPQPPEDV